MNSKNLQRLLPWIVIILAVFLVYANTWDNPFLYDDEFLIVKNSFLRGWDHFFRIFVSSSTAGFGGRDNFYRPMQILLYFLVYQVSGLDTWGYHLLNISLHAVNACLLFAFAQRLGLSRKLALFASLLWALHPIHNESVTYMSATADPLYPCFVLAGLLAWFRADAWRWRGIAIACFVLALMSKESAVVMPALVIACSFFLYPRDWKKVKQSLPLWLIAGAYLFARQNILNFQDSFHFYKTTNVYTESILVRTCTFLATVPEALGVLFWPTDLRMDHNAAVFLDFAAPQVWLGIAIIGSLFALFLWDLKRRRAGMGTWLFLWLGGSYFPFTGILIPMNGFFFEHWLYLPGMGIAIALVASLQWLGPAILILIPVFALEAFLAFEQNKVWQNPIRFYQHLIKYSPKLARAHNNLAMAFSDIQNVDAAIMEYNTAIQLEDNYPQTHHNLALAYLSKGQLDEAENELHRALQMDPEFFFSYDYLAEIAMRKGKSEDAKSLRLKGQEIRRRRGL